MSGHCHACLRVLCICASEGEHTDVSFHLEGFDDDDVTRQIDSRYQLALDEHYSGVDKEDESPPESAPIVLEAAEPPMDDQNETKDEPLEDDERFTGDDEDQYWLTPLQRFERKLQEQAAPG